MITATLHPVLWIVFWIFAPGFTICALALICYAVFGPPTGVELEEKTFLDRLDSKAAAVKRAQRELADRSPPAIRKDGSVDAGENGPFLFEVEDTFFVEGRGVVYLGKNPVSSKTRDFMELKTRGVTIDGVLRKVIDVEAFRPMTPAYLNESIGLLLEPVCPTCRDKGTVDETLGGHAFANPEAPCPDCKP